MRIIEPPVRRGSTTISLLIAGIRSTSAVMKVSIGVSTASTYRSRWAANHSRSLWRLRSRRNVNRLGGNDDDMAVAPGESRLAGARLSYRPGGTLVGRGRQTADVARPGPIVRPETTCREDWWAPRGSHGNVPQLARHAH